MKPHHRLLDFVSHLDSADRNAAERALFAEHPAPRVASRPDPDDDLVQRFGRELEALGGEVLDATSRTIEDLLTPWLVDLTDALGRPPRVVVEQQVESMSRLLTCLRVNGCEVPGTADTATHHEVPGTADTATHHEVPGTATGYEVPGTATGYEVPGTAAGYEVPGTATGYEVPGTSTTADLARVDVGVTLVDMAVAETGSLVETLQPGRPRALSLLPPVHLAVLPVGRLVADLEAMFDGMDDDFENPEGSFAAYFTCISGPSRTADIEKVLTVGVHGPGRLAVLIVGDDTLS